MSERTVLVRYRGDVQGVGFRETTRRIAAGFSIKGWVKNDGDGSVSMIATVVTVISPVGLCRRRQW